MFVHARCAAAPYVVLVTGQLVDTPTRGLPTRGLDDSRTGYLAVWSTHALVNSRTGQVADWTTRGCHRRLYILSFRSLGGICETASCLVRELTSPPDVQSASWRIRELCSSRCGECCKRVLTSAACCSILRHIAVKTTHSTEPQRTACELTSTILCNLITEIITRQQVNLKMFFVQSQRK